MLISGEYFDPWNPDPSVITLEVLAHGMAQQVRFNGHTVRPVTVAEHCMRVARIAAGSLETPRHAAAVRLDALLHDAHEPLVPWGDCLSPGKTDEMRAVESNVDAAIREALGLPPSLAGVARKVKRADLIALLLEALIWQPGASDWVCDLPHAPASARDYQRLLPLVWPRPSECWATEVRCALGECRRASDG